MVDHYKILEVDKNANEETIRKSYKRLALKYHPDRNKDNQEEATQKFKKISEAYDILGNKVNTIISQELDPGRHVVTWHAVDRNNNKLSSGVYFYRLSSVDFTATRKFILLK